MSEAAYYRELEASERRLSELRAANRESVKRVQDKITDEKTQHQARIAEKERKHRENMLRQWNSSVAERNAAEEIHRKSVEKFNEEHKTYMAKLEKQLEKINEKGEQDVKEVEQQRVKLEEQRTEDLVKHHESMANLSEKKYKEIEKQRVEQHMLKMEELNAKSKQNTSLYQIQMKNINDSHNMQLSIEKSNASLAVIQHSESCIESFNVILGLLKDMKELSENKDHYLPADLKKIKYTSDEIEKHKSKLEFRNQQLESSRTLEINADPRVIGGSSEMSIKVKRCIESSGFRSVCTLPSLAAQQDLARISTIMDKIDSLTNKMDAISEEVQRNTIQWQQDGNSSMKALTHTNGS